MCCRPICGSLSGDHAAAFASLAAAEEHMVSTGERYTEAELYRFKGRLLMAQPHPDVEAATAAFEQAVAAAHRQHAALLELRAATTLALHQRQTGAPAAALERVAELSDRLSAHAALADLVQARAAARSAGGGPMTHVTIAGGGLAGLSAALRLAERGYRVKLYESKDVLGGNVASRHVGERVWLDVYPHMYLNWYHNFWALLADVTDADREQLFRPMEGVQWLRAGTYPRFRGLKNPYRPRNLLRNLIDGPAPAADLYLFLYASIDLMAERLNPTLRLGDVSVNGFLRARPYMTERTAEFFDDLIVDIWGIPSYLAAADDYQEFLEYSVADPSPPFWLARGSGHDQVLAPLEAKLRALGVEIELRDAARQRLVREGARDRDRPARRGRRDPHRGRRRAAAGVAARGACRASCAAANRRS